MKSNRFKVGDRLVLNPEISEMTGVLEHCMGDQVAVVTKCAVYNKPAVDIHVESNGHTSTGWWEQWFILAEERTFSRSDRKFVFGK